MVLEMQKMGIPVERQHHEVATAGQAEIDIRFDSLVNMGDKLMMFKYIVKNVEMQKMGIPVERQHHEVATAGQAEIDIRFDSLVNMGDKLMMFKYIVKNV